MKQCKRCGRKLPNDARICAYCGLKLSGQQSSSSKTGTRKSASKKSSNSSDRSTYDRYRKKKLQQEAKKKRRRRRIRFLIFWLIVLTILGAVFGGMYANKHYKSVINPSSEETVETGEQGVLNSEKNEDDKSPESDTTTEPVKEIEATPTATAKSETLGDKIENGGCTVYEDASYGFKCAYPADFAEGTLKNNNTRVSFTDVDGGADVLINFEKIGKSETPQTLLDDYLNIIGVDPDVDNSGTNFYSVTFTRGGRIYHRKALVAKEKYIYYDFMYDQGSDRKSRYEDYIDLMDMYLEQANKELLKK